MLRERPRPLLVERRARMREAVVQAARRAAWVLEIPKTPVLEVSRWKAECQTMPVLQALMMVGR